MAIEDHLNEGETLDGNVISAGNVPIAMIVAGERVALPTTKAQAATEEVLKQKLTTIGGKQVLFQRIQRGDEVINRFSHTYLNTGADGLPVGPEGYMSKSEKPAQLPTATVDGVTFGLRKTQTWSEEDRQAVISNLQALA